MHKKSTIKVCLINNAAYYTDITLDAVKDLNQVLLSNQLGHACSKTTKIIQRKVHFLYTKNLPTELPGYGLGKSGGT